MSVPIVDQSYIDARARVLDVAAFLDRVQRHGQDGDFRVAALRQAIEVLLTPEIGRAERILLTLSDKSTEPIPVATTQGATGAPPAL